MPTRFLRPTTSRRRPATTASPEVLEHILRRGGARHALSLRARQSRIIGSWRGELSRTRPISKMAPASLREPLWPTSGAGWKP
jgi:hypothetical protein